MNGGSADVQIIGEVNIDYNYYIAPYVKNAQNFVKGQNEQMNF